MLSRSSSTTSVSWLCETGCIFSPFASTGCSWTWKLKRKGSNTSEEWSVFTGSEDFMSVSFAGVFSVPYFVPVFPSRKKISGLKILRWVTGPFPHVGNMPIHWGWSLKVLSLLCWVFYLKSFTFGHNGENYSLLPFVPSPTSFFAFSILHLLFLHLPFLPVFLPMSGNRFN